MSNESAARPRIAVVYGGRSDEHSVSCITAGSVLAAIDPAVYDVVPIGITRDGRWLLQSGETGRLRLGADGEMPIVEETGAPVHIVRGRGAGELLVEGREEGRIDAVFPLLHGPWGEDGTIQGLLEMAGTRYVGSGVLASAVGMDKHYMKIALRAAGLPVIPHVLVTDAGWAQDPEACREAVRALGLPVFVKPARAGSSFGISKVVDLAELDVAIETARKHDPRVLVEEYAGDGAREIECGVLQAGIGERPQVTQLSEILVSGHDFYDLEAKYLPDQGTEAVLPADLDEETTRRIQDLSALAFEALGCEGLARVDFFVRGGGQIVINELNTMPGFTPTSQFPLMWAASGLDYPALVDRLIRLALGRSADLR